MAVALVKGRSLVKRLVSSALVKNSRIRFFWIHISCKLHAFGATFFKYILKRETIHSRIQSKDCSVFNKPYFKIENNNSFWGKCLLESSPMSNGSTNEPTNRFRAEIRITFVIMKLK